jgi:glucokinase
MTLYIPGRLTRLINPEKFMTINTSIPFVLTADIGGSHITTAICNTSTNTIIKESVARVNVSSKDTAENIFHAWNSSFQQSLDAVKLNIAGLGIAMPGPFDYDKGISYITGLDKFDAIYGLNIREKLAGTLGLDPLSILFRNDAEAAVAGEVWAHFGKSWQNIIGITLGTGFGSAHYLGGATKDINWGSFAFKDSIADDYFSTRWFLKRYFELTGHRLEEVRQLAKLVQSDERALAVFSEFAIALGDFLERGMLPLQPQALVICGNIARASAFFLPALKERFKDIPIELALLGEDAPLFGVASLFQEITMNP